MQFDKVFRVLGRQDVKEVALQTDRPPCALVGDQWVPLVSVNLKEDEVVGALVATGGRAEVLSLVEGARSWQFQLDGVGLVRVSAGYRGSTLQARFKRVGERDTPSFSQLEPASPPPRTSDPQPARATPARPSLAEPPREMPRPPQASTRAQPLELRDVPEPPRDLAEPPLRLATLAEPRVVPPEPARPAPVAAVALGGDPSEALAQLLRHARDRAASDIHIIAERAAQARIGGELVAISAPIPAARVSAMIDGVLSARSARDLEETGSADFALAHPTCGRFRANASRQRTGHKLTLRPIAAKAPSLAELGLPDAIAQATHHHQGLIVVTGPTGHGKTTTLAAIIDVLNSEHTHHIITVEDPIEYVHERKRSMISQREVGTHTRSFAAALKGSLREDPDVIVVGELRDTETVRMALSASETGHLVIATMNTQSAAKTIERIIDLFPPGDQPQVRMTLAGGLRLIIAQRLVPSADRSRVHAAVELLPGSPPLWAMIRDNKTFQIPSLQQRGKALGIIRLDDSLAELVRSGKTSLETAQRYADAPEQLELLVNGRK
jgi:twitching motility protein PilT